MKPTHAQWDRLSSRSISAISYTSCAMGKKTPHPHLRRFVYFIGSVQLPKTSWKAGSTALSLSVVFSLIALELAVASQPVPPDPKILYPIIVPAVIEALPFPFSARFREHRDTVIGEVAALDPGWQNDARGEHYMAWLDFAAPEGASAEVRMAAAQEFPLDRETAKQKGYRDEVYGDLPFILQDHFHALVEAFRGAQWKAARENAVGIIHYACAVGLPTQLTREIKKGRPGRELLWHVNAQRTRFEYEVRVFPGRFERAIDARTEILSKLQSSHAAAFKLYEIVEQAHKKTGISAHDYPLISAFISVRGESDLRKEFNRLVREPAAELMCEQLKNSALLAANLIGTAWMDAGSPEVPMDTFAPRADDKPGDTAKKESADKSGIAAGDQQKTAAAGALDLVADKFMGSSGSETYHRSSCQHAARIKPENTIRFTSLEEAQRAGRKACQTCKPDSK